ncbi:hypothetical protein NQZ68_014182 [Dissostichus eleginoides]|nr:hypothetical protein NQZ68_014182 [Dissostichus eleginoides]
MATSPCTKPEKNTTECRGTGTTLIPIPRIRTKSPVLDLSENGSTELRMYESYDAVSLKIFTGTLMSLPTNDTHPFDKNAEKPGSFNSHGSTTCRQGETTGKGITDTAQAAELIWPPLSPLLSFGTVSFPVPSPPAEVTDLRWVNPWLPSHRTFSITQVCMSFLLPSTCCTIHSFLLDPEVPTAPVYQHVVISQYSSLCSSLHLALADVNCNVAGCSREKPSSSSSEGALTKSSTLSIVTTLCGTLTLLPQPGRYRGPSL